MMLRPTFIILLFGLVVSCKNSRNEQSTIKTNTPVKSAQDQEVIRERWIGVVKDDSEGYYLLYPCDGRIPSISVVNSKMIDDRGLDRPVEYFIAHSNLNEEGEGELKTILEWQGGRLSDSIVIQRINYLVPTFKWVRHPKLNGVDQDLIVSYFVSEQDTSRIKSIRTPCWEQGKPLNKNQ